jgi:endonuclease/exonuclease/phosphatase family metal-dependent hydrolase
MAAFRAMTFNVRGDRFADAANVWPARADLNVRTILRHAPDLVGFQELAQGNLDIYRERLPGYQHILGPGYGNREPFQYPTILYRPERLRLLDAGGFWLSETPEVHSAAWDTDCIRSAAWARFALPEGGDVLALNTHLDHISAWARLEGARLIASRLPALAAGAPVVVTGDFNCPPGSPPYQALADVGLADAYRALHGDAARPTFHGFQGPAIRPRPGTDDTNDRIDWVLVRGLRALACEIIEDAEPPLYPSDHYPVLADLEIP